MNKVISRNYTECTEAASKLDETIFHNANGYIGVRASLEEGVPSDWDSMRGTYINGFYNIIPMKQAEQLCNLVDRKDALVNVADTMTVKCKLDGASFNMLEGKLISHTRTLDMEKGLTERKVVWESKAGETFEITVKRLTSFKLLSLFEMEYTVRPLTKDTIIEIMSVHNWGVKNYSNSKDPRVAAESVPSLENIYHEIKEGKSIQLSKTTTSGLTMCSMTCNEVTGPKGEKVEGIYEEGQSFATQRFSCRVAKDGCMVLHKYNIYTDSRREKDPKDAAEKYMKEAAGNGFEYYVNLQKEYMDKFWCHGDFGIDGDPASDLAMTFNMYELLQSAAKDQYCSIAAKGVSGEGYEGHYFWDTEIYVLPFFDLVYPKLAKQILLYRYHTMDKARENALANGHKKGVLFPWRTITGVECSGYFVSGTAACHINADIAYAVVRYYLASGDLDFIAEAGLSLVLETARLWMDLGNYNRKGQFVINDVTGPDEYTCMVNNNYFTNCAAKYNLEWAVKFYRMLEKEGGADLSAYGVTEEELSAMSSAAENMLLLYDEKLGINPQDDSFLDKPVWDFENTPAENHPLLIYYHPLDLYRHQVCKQADTVLAYFMFEDRQDFETMKRSYDYYEKITTHDSTLSTCAFSIVAARLGMHEKSFEYFGDSARIDLENTHKNTSDGIHTANMGGGYMAIVNGFAGLRISEEGLSLCPFVPGDWKGYHFTIMYHGSKLLIEVDRQKVQVKLLSGEEVEIKLYHKEQRLSKDKPIICDLKQDEIAVKAKEK